MSTGLGTRRVSLRALRKGRPGFEITLAQAGAGKHEVGSWAAEHSGELKRAVQAEGAILLRGFSHHGEASLSNVIRVLGGETMDYRYGGAPRTKLTPDIYTSTEYDSRFVLPQHSELSYSTAWPRLVAFMCIESPATGGETPIADNRRVHLSLSERVRSRFADGILYVRNYPPDSAKVASWVRSFETEDRDAVEEFCRTRGIDYRWLPGAYLYTEQHNVATRPHPDTGEELWFNQAHLFHSSSFGRRTDLVTLNPRRLRRLPRNALYGDGTRIPTRVINAIKAAYDDNTFMFSWEPGDILVLDNMVFAHGRRPFTGARKVLVGMAAPSGPTP